jgi:hypothetical protein
MPDVFIGVWDHLAGQDPYGNMTGRRRTQKVRDLVFLQTWETTVCGASSRR